MRNLEPGGSALRLRLPGISPTTEKSDAQPNASTAAADTTVRRPAKTSVNICIRFRSRSLIVTSPILVSVTSNWRNHDISKEGYNSCCCKA